MTTIAELLERVQTRLFLLSGLDIQIHAETQLIEMLRGCYNTLFQDFWYPEFTYPMVQTLDGTTGQVTANLSNEIFRFADIHSVLLGTSTTPLPFLSIGTNVSQVSRTCVAPSTDPQKVFKIFPVTENDVVTIWYRKKLADSVWTEPNLPAIMNFDDDVLLYGAVYEFLANDDSNPAATELYMKKYQQRQDQIRKAQWNIPISKTALNNSGAATRWE